jgi:DNA-binding response OmpR family regulator
MAAMSARARILVVEDEPRLAEILRLYLERDGHQVTVVGDGRAAIEAVDRDPVDLVVLDLMLPGFDGLEVCERIQQDRPVPVLMLTARGSESDLVVGLGVGADDYMTKPFSTRELVARVHALIRRVDRARVEGHDPAPRAPITLGDLAVDPISRRVERDGQVVHLTPTEFDLLAFLAEAPGRVFTRDELLGQVWGYEVAFGGRTVDSHVRALRRKLGTDLIRTVHGVGYAVEPDGGA